MAILVLSPNVNPRLSAQVARGETGCQTTFQVKYIRIAACEEQYKRYILHYMLYILNFTLYAKHSTQYILYSTLYTLHITFNSALYIIHTARYILPTPYTLHSTICSLYHSPKLSPNGPRQ